MSRLLAMPDELLGAIIEQTDTAADTARLGQVCKRLHNLEAGSPVWERHCFSTWSSWHPRYEIDSKLALPALQTDWRALFHERRLADNQSLDIFEALLSTQQARAARIGELAEKDTDAYDLFVRVARNTPDEADDVLARRWHADAITRLMHRRRAVETWARLERGEDVEPIEALGAFDDFVFGTACTADIINPSLDRHATDLVKEFPEFERATTRRKAVLVALYLHVHRLVGTANPESYHSLPNNFLSTALLNTRRRHWGCLPLQSVIIYCALARRLGIDAFPVNFPRHVHAIVHAPPDETLDGNNRSENEPAGATPTDALVMYMDPFDQTAEVAIRHLRVLLTEMAVPPGSQDACLRPARTMEMVLRSGRNISISVDNLRARGMQPEADGFGEVYGNFELGAALYAAMWSHFILGDNDPLRAGPFRRQGVRRMLHHLQAEHPQDATLLLQMASRLLSDAPELPWLETHLSALQAADRHARVAKRRLANGEPAVGHPVGTYFEHGNYGYRGFITGWDTQCGADPEWIQEMGVDTLPRGRNQPFYYVIAHDRSSHYVAEENIRPLSDRPLPELMALAGRYFKRWDEEKHMFVNNLLQQYPEG